MYIGVTRDYLVKLAKEAVRLGVRVGGGVHFMVEPRYLKTLASLVSGMATLEVGFGLGFLTMYLNQSASHVYACDVDWRMAYAVKALKMPLGDVDLFICDALSFKPARSLAVASNMPYNITSPLLIRLMRDYKPIKLALTVQREVAHRIMAKPGSRNYGRLSVISQCLMNISYIATIPPSAFWPRPRVYSAIVELTPKEPCGNIDAIEWFTGRVFTQPNRVLRGVLKRVFGEESLKYTPPELLGKRVRELGLSEVAELAQALWPLRGELR